MPEPNLRRIRLRLLDMVELVSKSENEGPQKQFLDFIRPQLYSRQKYRGTRLLTAKLIRL